MILCHIDMSSRVKRNIDVLRVLNKATPKLRKAILSNSNRELLLALCEVIANVLSGSVQLKPKHKKSLRRHCGVLRKIADKSTPLKAKKKLIVQKGGFLPAVLGPALGVLATIIGELI